MASSLSSSNDSCFVSLHDGFQRHDRHPASSAFQRRDKSVGIRKLIIKLNQELSIEEFHDIKFLFGGKMFLRIYAFFINVTLNMGVYRFHIWNCPFSILGIKYAACNNYIK